MSVAFLFSGQGSQYVGMGRDFYENFDIARKTFELASDSIGFDLVNIIFNDSTLLDITEITQPAILTVSTAIFNVLKNEMPLPNFVAGLSLGEYTAYVASGAIDFYDAVFLTYNRGKFMSEAVPNGEGSMSAIIGIDKLLVEQACNEASSRGFVSIANYNAPGQVVISGYTDAVLLASDICKKFGAKFIVKLNVSGPFHTDLLKPAAVKLRTLISNIRFNDFSIPVITNVSGQLVNSVLQIPDILTKQIISPVRWEESVNTLIDMGVDTFIEVGPGKVLSGFVKKINKGVNALNIENLKSFDDILKRSNYV